MLCVIRNIMYMQITREIFNCSCSLANNALHSSSDMPFQFVNPGMTASVAISAENHVEVNTVDRYQGRDKDCIIISYVRNNPNKNVSAYIHNLIM